MASLSYQQLAQSAIGSALTQSFTSQEHEAILRVVHSCQYMSSDTNIIANAVKRVTKSFDWTRLVAELCAAYKITRKNEIERLKAAIRIEIQANANYWMGFDKTILVMSELPNVSEEHLTTPVAEIYDREQITAEVNTAILGTIHLFCPDMPKAKMTQFAQMLEAAYERNKKMMGCGT